MPFFVGVDVGTQSVRAGLFDDKGKEINIASVPISTYKPSPDLFEQSAIEIWNASCDAVKRVVLDVAPKDVIGVGFDATCSLVAVGKDLEPINLTGTDNRDQSVILWMDHRAIEEAEIINKLNHRCLNAVGGIISPEMQPPKLMWLKKNLRTKYDSVKYFFDLPDFLTWKATGSLVRSSCSTTCKWLYQNEPSKSEWVNDFWCKIGLEDLISGDYDKIGSSIKNPGTVCGHLNADVAKRMGLSEGTIVATSVIDAYAGALGVLACQSSQSLPEMCEIENRIAFIAGTSTCLIKLSSVPIPVKGVWGPYYNVLLPKFWCNEAGQSAAGCLLDHILQLQSNSEFLLKKMTENSSKEYIADMLDLTLKKLSEDKGLPSISYLTSDYHVYPDYHGNRSPLADPSLKGMVCGLTLATDVESYAIRYLATVQGLAYSARYIIEHLKKSGHVINCMIITGGLSNNDLYVKMHSDVTGLPIINPNKKEPVLLGAAMLAAVATKHFTFEKAMASMSGKGKIIMPHTADAEYHNKKYKVFLEMLTCQQKWKKIMDNN